MRHRKIDVNFLKRICPLPDLLHRVGLGLYAKSSCPSPFRQDQKASWGIFQYAGRWMYKDFGTGEVGDEIGLLAKLNNLNAHDDFLEILKIYRNLSKRKLPSIAPMPAPTPTPTTLKIKPNSTGFGPGTDEQIATLSGLRGISIAGLQYAQARGVLIFGDWCGSEVYGVTDQSGRLIELRRLDGLNFPAWGNLAERKSHALRGSQKDWPLGIMEASQCDCLALAEGLPDFLALHQYVVQENAQQRVGPVALLSAAVDISAEALIHFKGRHVRIYPHLDAAGIKAAEKWQATLLAAGASKVDFFNFAAVKSSAGSCVKDLCQFNQLQVAGSEAMEGSILP